MFLKLNIFFFVCEGHKGSKSIIRSSYSGYKGKDLASSSSGLRLPLPKMGFFDSVCFQRKHNLAAMVYLVVKKKSYT